MFLRRRPACATAWPPCTTRLAQYRTAIASRCWRDSDASCAYVPIRARKAGLRNAAWFRRISTTASRSWSQDNANTPVQARGTTRAELNMHVTASRDGDHLYQLKDGEKIDILRRATAPKNPPKAVKPATPTSAKPAAGKTGNRKEGNAGAAAKVGHTTFSPAACSL